MFKSFEKKEMLIFASIGFLEIAFKFYTLVSLNYLNKSDNLDFKSITTTFLTKTKAMYFAYASLSIPYYISIYYLISQQQTVRNSIRTIFSFLPPQISSEVHLNIETYIGLLIAIPMFCILEFLPVTALLDEKKWKDIIRSSYYFVIHNSRSIITFFCVITSLALSATILSIVVAIGIPIVGKSILVAIVKTIFVTFSHSFLLTFYKSCRSTTSSVV
ncbi:hypothetical protein HOH45_06795 [bacterium]|nr:hypothetical protein [bacterium]